MVVDGGNVMKPEYRSPMVDRSNRIRFQGVAHIVVVLSQQASRMPSICESDVT